MSAISSKTLQVFNFEYLQILAYISVQIPPRPHVSYSKQGPFKEAEIVSAADYTKKVKMSKESYPI